MKKRGYFMASCSIQEKLAAIDLLGFTLDF